MILYHRTRRDKALAILANGFRDLVSTPETDQATRQDFAGVWLQATLPGKRRDDDALLQITLDMTPEELAEYEWQGDRSEKEWLIPAALITAYGRVEVLD